MAYFSKFKIGSTTYDVKDASAGKTLALNGSTLQLKNAAGTVVSSITLPGGGGGGAKVFFAEFSATAEPYLWNNTSITCTGLYDGEGNQADWVDITTDSIVYGIFTCGNEHDPGIYVAPLTQDLAASAGNIKAFRAIVMGDPNNDTVPAKLGFFYGEYNTNVEQWVTGPRGTAQALGGGGGTVVYDVYDSSGQAMISTSNINPSGNITLINGSSAIHASDIDPEGSYIFKFTDCTIPVDNIEVYNKAITLNALVGGSPFKVRFVNQWGDNWEYTKYN